MSDHQPSSRVDLLIEALSDFIRERFSVPADDSNFHPDVHLWNEGYVDSLGIAEVVAFVEERFGIVLPDDVFFDESHLTIAGLAGFAVTLTVPTPGSSSVRAVFAPPSSSNAASG
jgi:acyl carrier protein